MEQVNLHAAQYLLDIDSFLGKEPCLKLFYLLEWTSFLRPPSKIDEALVNRSKQLAVKSQNLVDIIKRIERNEERLMDDEISSETYKNGIAKFLE